MNGIDNRAWGAGALIVGGVFVLVTLAGRVGIIAFEPPLGSLVAGGVLIGLGLYLRRLP